jgi:hypothetical protein
VFVSLDGPRRINHSVNASAGPPMIVDPETGALILAPTMRSWHRSLRLRDEYRRGQARRRLETVRVALGRRPAPPIGQAHLAPQGTSREGGSRRRRAETASRAGDGGDREPPSDDPDLEPPGRERRAAGPPRLVASLALEGTPNVVVVAQSWEDEHALQMWLAEGALLDLANTLLDLQERLAGLGEDGAT